MPVLTHVRKEPSFWQIKLDALSRLGPWQTQDEILSRALDVLLDSFPDLRRKVALDLYQREEVTLSRAAEIAGMNRWAFRDLLHEQGVEIVMPDPTPEEMDAAIATFKEARHDHLG